MASQSGPKRTLVSHSSTVQSADSSLLILTGPMLDYMAKCPGGEVSDTLSLVSELIS